MSPRDLRLRAGVSELRAADYMGIGVGTLKLLEACPVDAWKVEQLRQHLRACGATLQLTSVGDEGSQEVIT